MPLRLRSRLNQTSLSLLTVFAALVFGFQFASPASAQTPAQTDPALLDTAKPRPDLYSADADTKKEIADALVVAGRENKRVFIVFGANWCYDCHVLDRALHEGPAGEIFSRHFLLVHVDIGEGERNAELVKTYKIPLDKGVPAVAILHGDGRLLYSSGHGEFEAARRMLRKDLVAFLNLWKVPAP